MRAARLLILCCLILTGCATHPGTVPKVRFARDAHPVLATTSEGVVRGVEGNGVRAFLGLPYAAPPVADRRWRAPAAPVAWTGVRNATRTGSDCTQALGRKAILGGGGGLVVGAEDCLFLNIYAPAAAGRVAADADRPLPVMVYLHGGAFTIGSGANYDPTRLAVQQGRIVVTVNFRLGALGWLAHPGFANDGIDGKGDDWIGGNWGLMDQQAALRWVQANIGVFGGDPRDVTLFAESSGAWSACYLMAAPSSAGLWSRVILQSGPCLEPSSLNAAADQIGPGVAFAEQIGCSGDQAFACLKHLPAATLARAASRRSGINGPGSWGPVYGDLLVPISPATAFVTGAFVRTPVIVGTNTDEGRLFAVAVHDADRYAKETVWLYGLDGERALARYPVDAADGKARYAIAIAQSFTDSRFACPSDGLRRVLAQWVPVHGYEFADRGAPFLLPSWITGLRMGAYHASELASVFGNSWLFADTGRWTDAQRALSGRMMALWAGFGHDAAFGAEWPRVSNGGGPVRVFDPARDRIDDTFFERHQCAFWGGTALGAVIE